jgi:hypothetical protein
LLELVDTFDRRRPSANRVKATNARGSSGEEISPFRAARAFRKQFAGVPVDRVAETFLVRRKVAFKHATSRPEDFDTGLDIGAHRIRHHLGRRRLGLLLKSKTVDGLAEPADFDVDIFVAASALIDAAQRGNFSFSLPA